MKRIKYKYIFLFLFLIINSNARGMSDESSDGEKYSPARPESAPSAVKRRHASPAGSPLTKRRPPASSPGLVTADEMSAVAPPGRQGASSLRASPPDSAPEGGADHVVLRFVITEPPVTPSAFNPYTTAAVRARDSFVQHSQVFPWNVHGCLMVRAIYPELGQIREFVASGILIQPRYVLTAAHIVKDPDHPTAFVDKISFYPALKALEDLEGGKIPYVHVDLIAMDKDFYTSYGSVDSLMLKQKDLALLRLTKELEFPTYDIPRMSEEDARRIIHQINVTGYPAEKEYDGWYMTSQTVAISHIAGGTIHYATRTLRGQSGGGVWFLKDGKHFCVGVHTHGNGVDRATATFLTPENIERIQDWIRAMERYE